MWQNREPKPMTKCMNCKNACGETACSWAREFKPVDGWVAEPTVLSPNQNYREDSYLVLYCPQFEKGHSEVKWDEADARMLAIETLIQAVEDWKSLDYGKIDERRTKSEVIFAKDLVQFFNSKYFAYLLRLTVNYNAKRVRQALHVPELEVVVWK